MRSPWIPTRPRSRPSRSPTPPTTSSTIRSRPPSPSRSAASTMAAPARSPSRMASTPPSSSPSPATAPTAPTITSVTDDVAPVTGTLTSGASTNDTDLTVKVTLPATGSLAVAGDTVQLFNGAGTLGASHVLTAADITAGFVNLQTGTLTDGTTYSITAKVTDAAGNVSNASASFAVTEDTTAPNFIDGLNA